MPLPSEKSASSPIRVWDLGVRLFHWSLLLAVAAAALTGFFGSPDSLSIHLIAGITIAYLLLFRVIWGFSGSTFARFRTFIFAPSVMVARVKDIISGRHVRYLGHNPLGGAMVLALIGVLALILITGLVVLGGTIKQGPLAFITTYSTGGLVKEIHQILAFLLVGLIALHLVGVIYESIIGKEKLVQAMVTGDKPALPAVALPPMARARPVLALAIVGIVGLAGASATVSFSARPGLGVPVAALDPVYQKECGACHFAYHPSMGTKVLWSGIMAHLDQHFGEDASLPDATYTQLATYLADNSAEHWDTRIAHVLAKTNPENPLRFTATRFWTRMHHDIPEGVFKSKAVGFKGACNACHSDAKTGLFAPQNIEIPEGAHL